MRPLHGIRSLFSNDCTVGRGISDDESNLAHRLDGLRWRMNHLPRAPQHHADSAGAIDDKISRGVNFLPELPPGNQTTLTSIPPASILDVATALH